MELSHKFASQICHENTDTPLDGTYLADFGMNITTTTAGDEERWTQEPPTRPGVVQTECDGNNTNSQPCKELMNNIWRNMCIVPGQLYLCVYYTYTIEKYVNSYESGNGVSWLSNSIA